MASSSMAQRPREPTVKARGGLSSVQGERGGAVRSSGRLRRYWRFRGSLPCPFLPCSSGKQRTAVGTADDDGGPPSRSDVRLNGRRRRTEITNSGGRPRGSKRRNGQFRSWSQFSLGWLEVRIEG
nr:hypothetical protein Itr_chr02CG11520 [Ipomoea trifida]